MAEAPEPPAGIPGSALSGPWPVGTYAARLRDRLRGFTRVQVFGELFGVRVSRVKVYFELRDATGALPCSMWRQAFDGLEDASSFVDGARVIAAGGCDFYPGSTASSPAFSFSVTDLRPAGEGDLLAQVAALRRTFEAEGLLERQAQLARPSLPRTIGVITGEGGKARHDLVAALTRRGWGGRLVWAFAPVQDRHAAPRIARAAQDLAALAEVEVIVIARGGGSLADLMAFCDETLCRTIALLRVPVIASVGHHTDRTLIDDVAAVSCSTPTHAAEAAVALDPRAARADLASRAATLQRHGASAVIGRAQRLSVLSREPARQIRRHRDRLHQLLRELRASSGRSLASKAARSGRQATTLHRRAQASVGAQDRAGAHLGGRAASLHRAGGAATHRSRLELTHLASHLASHDPQRSLERGYALVETPDGAPVTSAADAAQRAELAVRFRDGRVTVRPQGRLPFDA